MRETDRGREGEAKGEREEQRETETGSAEREGERSATETKEGAGKSEEVGCLVSTRRHTLGRVSVLKRSGKWSSMPSSAVYASVHTGQQPYINALVCMRNGLGFARVDGRGATFLLWLLSKRILCVTVDNILLDFPETTQGQPPGETRPASPSSLRSQRVQATRKLPATVMVMAANAHRFCCL